MSECRRTSNGQRVQVFLDTSKREHMIESRIEDTRGRLVKSFKDIKVKSSLAELDWDHKKDDNSTAKDGIYIWYIKVDGILHNSTINDFSSV